VQKLPMRGLPWGPDDRTGGPLDRVLAEVRRQVPDLVVERLSDDHLFFLGDEFGLDRVQIACAPGGQPPFLIEDGGAVETSDVAEAAAVILSWLGDAP
jgi:hypothetical protein